MAKGQVTLPKDVRKVLGVTSGDRISFIVEGGTVLIVNSAVYAMQMLQGEMADEKKRAVLTSDDDVMALVKELRNETDVLLTGDKDFLESGLKNPKIYTFIPQEYNIFLYLHSGIQLPPLGHKAYRYSPIKYFPPPALLPFRNDTYILQSACLRIFL